MTRLFGEVFDFAAWLAGCVAASVLVGAGLGLFLHQLLIGGDLATVARRALQLGGFS